MSGAALASSHSLLAPPVECGQARAAAGRRGAAGADLRKRISELPGFGEMKIKSLGAVLAKRFGVSVAQDLVPGHPTLGAVDSAQALTDYQAAKKAHKAQWMASKSAH